jgi:molybdopterin synthase sulfur carrier subunit
MRILYFAWLRTKLGISEEMVECSDDIFDVDTLVSWIRTRGPHFHEAFDDMTIVRVAVNQEYVVDNVPLKDGDEIAFFPPVTGG